MKSTYHLLLLAGFTVFAYLQTFPQAGTLDNTFGNNGIVIYNYGQGYHDATFGVHVYTDSSILVCGSYMSGSTYIATGNLQKFLPDGSIDASWGTNGMVTFNYGVGGTFAYSMKVLSDGKILISGSTYITVANAAFFAARFNADGTPDLTFNGTGVWTYAYSTQEDICNTMILQFDGKIVLAGRSGGTVMNQLLFTRLNSDGTLDTGFGTNGFTAINSATQNENLNGLGLLSNGTIIGVGYTHVGNPWFGEFAIMVKLDSDGNPYAGFGTAGVMIPSVYTNYSQAFDCTIVNDTVIISSEMENGSQNLVVAKLDQNGNPDESFGTGGISTLSIDPLTYGYDIEYYQDNKFYICGTSGQSGLTAPRDFFLARYNYDGSIDGSFNGSGYVKTSVGSAWDHAFALDIGPDGKIVLAGFTAMGSTGDNDRALARYLNDYTPQPPLSADLKVFLDGPFNGTQMNTNLNPAHIPLSQPYNTAPWNYNGTESVASIPNADIVDWVLVEFRDATDASLATGSTMVSRQAAFLLKDGTVVSPDGSANISLSISTIQYSLFAVVWHRNHIGIMSAFPLINSGGIYTYDFTTGAGQVYGGSNGHKELAPGIWGMIGADGNADGQINNSDKLDIWTPQAGWSGYFSGDFNMDVQVNNLDKIDVWIPNSGSGGQVPY
jgi:uncharacterized delta-60 repeat protein